MLCRTSCPDGALEHVLHKLPRNLVVDVGVQQHPADLAEGLGDIRLGDLPLPAQALQDPSVFY